MADASFRSGQWEAIDALVNHKSRQLVVERTGWGKSTVYFIATRLLRDTGHGPTLIVSPLLALMRNQIEMAQRLAVRAVSINSSNQERWPDLQREVIGGGADVLLVSPERLANEEFVDKVLLPISTRLGMLVVDEVHCISDWGHDFRPDYRRLNQILRRMPRNLPILGTTATANDRVIEDVRAELGELQVQRGPMIRHTLELATMRLPTQAERLAWLAEYVGDLPGTGVIYVLTKRDAEHVSDWLNQKGFLVRPYYADVTHEDYPDSSKYRERLELALDRNEIKALVATTALGMGYDKPDLGFVIHYQAPGSIIAYYQQVGRAGRGIGRALGIMLTGVEDADIHSYFRRSAFPDEASVADVLKALEATDGLSVRQLEERLNLRYGKIGHVLKVLSVDNPAPVIKDGSRWRRTATPWSPDRERIQRLHAQREAEWREVQNYVDEPGCLMEFLARALDDPEPAPCGKCSGCLGRPLVVPTTSPATVIEASRFLKRSEMPLECPKQVAVDAFPEYGFRGNLNRTLRAETGRVLARWADAGWGKVVAAQKARGRFSDELVEAAAEMLRVRWKPEPRPRWVIAVPSLAHPNLVPDFADRLAAKLALPFVPAIEKIRPNEPQKMQENRFHQCRNLDGVFRIVGSIPEGPVLLVDDVVDSGWTLTVVAALMRQAGSGPVWPFALATANPGGR
ncbi:MAG: RecQ family ATP-dependent DNA helicase [Thiotrichales bacterium]|nr:RecQ family ATP-dependent DNA helicase [Thiotrichales bacterium]